MAKKLTQETLEKMVMTVLNESSDVNEVFGIFGKAFKDQGKPATTPFGRKPTLPKSGKAENDAVQLLRMIASDPKVPAGVKAQISDFLSYEPSTPEMKTDTDWDLEQLPTANITAISDEEPTAMMPTAKMTAAEKEIAKQKTAALSSPKAVAGPTMGKRPVAPSLSKAKSNVPTAVQFGGVRESKNLEALVAEVLAEMTKKKPAKETKKPVKK